MKFRLATTVLLFSILSVSPELSAADELRVAAPGLLKETLTEITRFFEKVNPQWKVLPLYGKTGELVKEIESGAPIDVFLTSDKDDLQELKEKKLTLNDSSVRLVSVALVLAGTAESDVTIQEPKDLLSDKIQQIALLKDTTPLGHQARNYLKKLNLLDTLSKKLIEAKDVKEAVSLLQKGTAQCTFLYSTDVANNTGLKILWSIQDPEIHEMAFQAAIIQTTAHLQIAKLFLDTLQSTIAKKIFENSGFQLLNPTTQTQTAPATH